MCKCDRKRANWYLSRNIAELVSEDPLIFKLKFKPNGPGNANDAYSLARKENKCVVCGTHENLTKHHIVPHMYRKFLPLEIKSRSSHDIVVICVPCHSKYETEAMTLKNLIHEQLTGKKIGLEKMSVEAANRLHVAKLSRTLMSRWELIPSDRREKIMLEVQSTVGVALTREDLSKIVAEFDFKHPRAFDEELPGKIAVESLKTDNDVRAFVEKWRRHFVMTAHPKYMPANWDVERPLLRENC